MEKDKMFLMGEYVFETRLKPIGDKGLKIQLNDNKFLIGMVCFSKSALVNELEDMDFFRAQFFEIGEESIKNKESCFYFNPSELFLGHDSKLLINMVQATVCRKTKKVRFGPKGSIMMSPQGLGIGTYLISRVIEWLKENYSSYEVVPISLSPVDAESLENRARRNTFYKNMGFELDFDDEHQKRGRCFAKTIDQLHPKILTKESKIQEVCLSEIMLLVSAYAKETKTKLKEVEQKYISEHNKFYSVNQKKNRLFRKRNEKRFIIVTGIITILNALGWIICFKIFK